MTFAILTIFALQGALMLVDELCFHRRRGLPLWERIGHPLDTSSVLACFAVALLFAPTSPALEAYGALAVLSCVLITKDEFVHARHCTPTEHWLHALLFILHPLVLIGAALLWISGQRAPLLVGACLTAAFGAYQALYWNLFVGEQGRAAAPAAPDPLHTRNLTN